MHYSLCNIYLCIVSIYNTYTCHRTQCNITSSISFHVGNHHIIIHNATHQHAIVHHVTRHKVIINIVIYHHAFHHYVTEHNIIIRNVAQNKLMIQVVTHPNVTIQIEYAMISSFTM